MYKFNRGEFVVKSSCFDDPNRHEAYGKVVDVNPETNEVRIIWADSFNQRYESPWLSMDCDWIRKLPLSQVLALMAQGLIPRDF